MITDQEYCWQDLELALIEKEETHSVSQTEDKNGHCSKCGMEGLAPLVQVGSKVWLYHNKCVACLYNYQLATEHYA